MPMQLGTLLDSLRHETSASRALEAIGDIVLYTRVASAADRYGETPAEYVVASVGRFAALGSDEAWLGLVSAMERAGDPGAAALRRLLEWALQEDISGNAATCGCGGAGSSCHDPH